MNGQSQKQIDFAISSRDAFLRSIERHRPMLIDVEDATEVAWLNTIIANIKRIEDASDVLYYLKGYSPDVVLEFVRKFTTKPRDEDDASDFYVWLGQ